MMCRLLKLNQILGVRNMRGKKKSEKVIKRECEFSDSTFSLSYKFTVIGRDFACFLSFTWSWKIETAAWQKPRHEISLGQ